MTNPAPRRGIPRINLFFRGAARLGESAIGVYEGLHGKVKIHRVGGFSSGALAAAVTAAAIQSGEASPNTLRERTDGYDPLTLFETHRTPRALSPLWMIESLLRFGALFHFGSYRAYVARVLRSYGVETWRDLRMEPGPDVPADAPWRAVILVQHRRTGKMLELPRDYAMFGLDPDEQLVADSVVASASIPLLYRARTLRDVFGRKQALIDPFVRLWAPVMRSIHVPESTPDIPTICVEVKTLFAKVIAHPDIETITVDPGKIFLFDPRRKPEISEGLIFAGRRAAQHFLRHRGADSGEAAA